MEKVKELTGGKKTITSMQMLAMHQSQLTTKIMPGSMYSFVYSPKHRDTLPLYDKFPLVLPFNKDATSFIGLNLHYLRPLRRVKLLDDLMQFAKFDKTGNPKTLELQWTYLQNVSRFPDVKMCVKRYLNGYVRSRFIKIMPEDWVMSCMLPTSNFAKGKPY